MDDFYEANHCRHKPWEKVLCVLLSVIIAFGALISLTASTEKFRNFIEMHSMLSDYALKTVSTKGAISIDKESMLSDNTLINLQNYDGSNTVYLFSEPVSFIDKDGKLQTKDISVERQKDKTLKMYHLISQEHITVLIKNGSLQPTARLQQLMTMSYPPFFPMTQN